MRIPQRELVAQLQERYAELMEEAEKVKLALEAFGAKPRTTGKRNLTNPDKLAELKRQPNAEVVAEVMRVLTELGSPATIAEIYVLGRFNGRSKQSVYDHIIASDQLARTDEHPTKVYINQGE